MTDSHNDPLQPIFNQLSGGRILDLATGRGGFIHTLLEYLPDYTELIGIDSSDNGAAAFAQTFSDERIRFQHMDATQIEFPDASFDLVSIAHSLHHLDNLPAVFAEMLRVLKPGGHLLVVEMYRDGQTTTQMTHVELHHWWAAIDRGLGISHHETFTRQEIYGQLVDLALVDPQTLDIKDLSQDPLAPEIVQQLDGAIDMYIQRAEGLPGQAGLQQRGEQLRQRVHTTGFHGATALFYIARKA